MQKLGTYIILIVIVALIGASTIVYVTLNQNQRIESSELTVIDIIFSGSDSINVTVVNSGTEDVTINQVRINGTTISSVNWALDSGNAEIAHDAGDYVEITSAWTAGNKYAITFYTLDGNILGSFIDTA